jgi:probable F420-dependent oxidoreductase
MKFAFGLPHMLELKAMMQPWEMGVTGADQQRLARRADELGYDMIAVPEHHIIPRAHLELSGSHYFHAATAQAFVAGATQKIKVNSCITILPLQNPIVQAKQLATLDWMSGGRAMVTFGVGWLEGEFEILGVPFNERGRIADEYLEAMVELWTKEEPQYEGRYVSFKDVAFGPKPIQKPHLPIWMGGDADAALKRAARFANGWWPFLTKPRDLPARIDFIKSQPTFKGGPFEVMYGLSSGRVGEGHVATNDPDAQAGLPPQQIIDRLGQLHELGVTMSSVPIPPVADIEAYLDHVQWVMEEIKPKVP